jgi:hypothetical protein
VVEKNSEAHLVAGGTVFGKGAQCDICDRRSDMQSIVSGTIPRITDFESGGLMGSVQWFDENGKGGWKPDTVSTSIDKRTAYLFHSSK